MRVADTVRGALGKYVVGADELGLDLGHLQLLLSDGHLARLRRWGGSGRCGRRGRCGEGCRSALKGRIRYTQCLALCDL